MLDWNDLRFFATVARTGSFAAAGRALGVSHTTVSRRIQAMASQLETPLIEPDAQGIRLTAAGAEVFAAAERCEAELRELELKLEGQNQLSGSLRVTMVDLLATFLVNAFCRFGRAYPGVTIELNVDHGFSDLSRREADVALRVTKASPPPHLVGWKVGKVHFARYASRALLETGADPLPRLEWEGVPRDEPGHVAARSSSASLLLELCRGGLGTATLPRIVGDEDPILRCVPGSDTVMDLWVLTHPGLKSNARVRALLDHLHDDLAPLVRALHGFDQRVARSGASEGGFDEP
jgi:DNA-binding transcriptional LysR family regulator